MSHGWKKIRDGYKHEPTGAIATNTDGEQYRGPNKGCGWVVTLGEHVLRCMFMRPANTAISSRSGMQTAAEWAEAKASGRPWIGGRS